MLTNKLQNQTWYSKTFKSLEKRDGDASHNIQTFFVLLRALHFLVDM
jgi:hypothetical protein